jgi:hypothetical protein
MRSISRPAAASSPVWRDIITAGFDGGWIMLAEKFMLFLEALISARNRSYPDGAPRVVSTSPHVPVKLPGSK